FQPYPHLFFHHYPHNLKYSLTINQQNIIILHRSPLPTLHPNLQNPKKQLYHHNHHILLTHPKPMTLSHPFLP
ncbi:family 1 glycosylhydrolase, partial [Bacillus altitudinis]|uniref:family 1 glycosylhydrolase n=1 Tax=Bacillus altitudinis TaxID=293387 RepID=UPI0011A283EB